MELIAVGIIVAVLIASALGIYFSRTRIASQTLQRERERQQIQTLRQGIESAERRQEEINQAKSQQGTASPAQRPGDDQK